MTCADDRVKYEAQKGMSLCRVRRGNTQHAVVDIPNIEHVRTTKRGKRGDAEDITDQKPMDMMTASILKILKLQFIKPLYVPLDSMQKLGRMTQYYV